MGFVENIEVEVEVEVLEVDILDLDVRLVAEVFATESVLVALVEDNEVEET